MTESRVTAYPFRFERTVWLGAFPEYAFAWLDDQARLAGHMSQPSWRTGWSVMTFTFDERQGKTPGALITLQGRVFGLTLFVQEVVRDYNPPHRKVWETVGTPRLLVISGYRMGFELTPAKTGCRLCLFIDYALPSRGFSQWLGRWLGRYYACWCVNRMIDDARATFPVQTTGPNANT